MRTSLGIVVIQPLLPYIVGLSLPDLGQLINDPLLHDRIDVNLGLAVDRHRVGVRLVRGLHVGKTGHVRRWREVNGVRPQIRSEHRGHNGGNFDKYDLVGMNGLWMFVG